MQDSAPHATSHRAHTAARDPPPSSAAHGAKPVAGHAAAHAAAGHRTPADASNSPHKGSAHGQSHSDGHGVPRDTPHGAPHGVQSRHNTTRNGTHEKRLELKQQATWQQAHVKHGARDASAALPPAGAEDHLRWLALLIAVTIALVVEEALLARLPEISMCTASIWLGAFVAYCAVLVAMLGASASWAAAGQSTSIMLLNIALSPDNLVVFMMFLKHAQLPTRHHRRVISDGFVFAIALRLATMLATSKLLEAFAPLQVLLAILVFAKGLHMVFEVWRKSAEAPPPDEAHDAAEHWSVKVLQSVVPVKWSEDTDGICLARDPSSGIYYVTRTTALTFAIGCSDLTFSSDNITAVLAITTDAFTVVSTMTLSILALRPVYFLAATFIDYLDALDSALGVILVIIGGKLILSQAGVEVPLWLVVSILTGWRVAVAAYVICTRRSG